MLEIAVYQEMNKTNKTFLKYVILGAPLMFANLGEKTPRWEAVGIVSFGPNACGKEGVPGVYTKVFDYIAWIYKNIEP